jgi:cobalamin biosynthesis protein CobT
LPLAKGIQLSPAMGKLMSRALAGLRAGLDNTAAAIALAQELATMEGQFASEQSTETQRGKPQKGGEGAGGGEASEGQGEASDGESDGEGDGSGESQDAAGEASKGSGEAGNEGKSKGQPSGQSGGESSGKGGQGAGDKGKAPQPQFEPDLNLGNAGREAIAHNGGSIQGRASHLNNIEVNRIPVYHGNKSSDAASRLDRLMPTSSVLHGQIARLMVSEERNMRTHHETVGRLDRRALARMRTGAPDVFSRRDYQPGTDTAMMILVDTSGSMSERMKTAQAAVWAIIKAADSAGGKLAVAGFTGGGAAVDLTIVKDWNESPLDCAHAVSSLKATLGTPLSAAIVTAAQDLANIQATRRILMVITDGMCSLGTEGVTMACKLASDYGVETVGIGIACSAVIAAFPPRYSVNVDDINQLAATGLGALVGMLEDAAGEAA